MAKRPSDPVSKYLAEIGRKGGKVTGVPKGTAALTPEERRERGRAGAEIRWGKKRTAKKAARAAKKK